MDWPHDPDGDEGSEGGRVYGLAIFAKKVADDDFPLTPSRCIEEFGDHPIRLDHERVVPASEILGELPEREFESKQSLLTALGSIMREVDLWTFERERYVTQ